MSDVEEVIDCDQEADEQRTEENIMKILVATDIHLGYNEKDPIRGNDSFNTFEEILKHAVSNDVDFLLLGGDLFHENKPSITCYHRCIMLLKKYCLGDKPIAIEFLSDPSKNFPHLINPVVNYEDPNLNVSIPVFSIHGNHDDPAGANQLSAMDIVADTGLVNYFGKWTDLTKIEIYPILMKKGISKLALFGLSHIKDERLFRLFRDKKVTMFFPQDPEWFNVLVLHQNRAQNRGSKNYIPETVLPNLLNLVIWGHEHDCLITPTLSENGSTRITQPGSSVATSLAIGESLPKKIGLLLVYKETFAMNEINLNTVRPFVFKEVSITKPDAALGCKPSEYAKEKIMNLVEEMLQEAKDQITEESPKLPLIRLVVNFTDESLMSNQIRLGQQYADKVANPTDMFSFKVKKFVTVKRDNKNDLKDLEDMLGDELTDNIGDLVDKYFESKDSTLQVLSTKGLCEAVTRFIDRNDTDALDDIFKHQIQKTFDKIMSIEDLELTEENIDDLLAQFKEQRKDNDDISEITKMLESHNRSRSHRSVEDIEEISDDDDTEIRSTVSSNSTYVPANTSRRARGRGSRGPRASRGSRARGKAT